MRPEDALLTRRMLTIQSAIGALASLMALPLGWPSAASVAIGSGTCILASRLVSAWVFQAYRAQEPGRLLLRIYAAQAAKLTLIAGIFSIAFVAFDELQVPALLAAYLLTQVASTLIAAQMRGHPGVRSRTER